MKKTLAAILVAASIALPSDMPVHASVSDPAHVDNITSPQRMHWLHGTIIYPYLGIEDAITEIRSRGITWWEYQMFRETGYHNRSDDTYGLLHAIRDAQDMQTEVEHVSSVVEETGVMPTINDIYLIRKIHDNYVLSELFFDRRALLRDAIILRGRTRPTFHRENHGRLYREDAELGPLDSLNLLRADILLDALREEETQRGIVSFIDAHEELDIDSLVDGEVLLDPVRIIPFRIHQESGPTEETPEMRGDPRIHNALCAVHVNGYWSETPTAGAGPDLFHLDQARMDYGAHVLITPLTRTERDATFNIDFYYLDRRRLPSTASALDPRRHEDYFSQAAHVIDLGTYTVAR